MEPYMRIDKYGKTNIRNIYFDTDTYELIRKSIENLSIKKTQSTELRMSGQRPDVFVELKKKYDGIVYKDVFRCLTKKQKGFLKSWISSN